MKILYLTQYFPPEPVPLQPDFVRILRERGHEVTVLTGFPCWPAGRTYEGWRQRLFGSSEVKDGVRIVRVPQFPDHSRSALRRIPYYVSFFFSASTLGFLRSGRADAVVVYQSAVPTGLAGWILARLRGAALVFHVVDLWPESVTSSGMLKNRAALWFLRKLSAFTYRRADVCAAITRGFVSRLMEMGVRHERLWFIAFWVPEAPAADSPESRIAAILPKKDAFRIVYAGNVGPLQGLESLVRAAELLPPDRFEFIVAGDGVDLQKLRDLAVEMRVSNLLFTGRLPQSAMPALFESADALLVQLVSNELSLVSVPSKMQAYMRAGKPVIAAIEGDTRFLVTHYDFGVCCDPCDAGALAGAIRRLSAFSVAERAEMGRRARRAYEERYSGAVQGVKLAELVETVAG